MKPEFIRHNLLLIFCSYEFILTGFTLSFSFKQLYKDQVKFRQGSACFQVTVMKEHGVFTASNVKHKITSSKPGYSCTRFQMKPARKLSRELIKIRKV